VRFAGAPCILDAGIHRHTNMRAPRAAERLSVRVRAHRSQGIDCVWDLPRVKRSHCSKSCAAQATL
jgi:hypothetical protein